MDDLRPTLSRVPAWKNAGEISVERIAGLTNANYRVTVDGSRFALRVSGPNTEKLGIDRNHELAALRSAAAAGLAPQVIAFLPPEGHLVTQWVEGRRWSAAEFRTPEHVRLLTRTVKRIHALPSNGSSFLPFRKVESFLESAREFGAPLPPDLASILEMMRTIEADQQRDATDWRHFCHNDLVSVNYLYVEQDRSIKVLDWEFSGMGDIYYDLATIVYTHDSDGPIPGELEEVMLSEYFGTVTGHHRRRLQGMKFMLMLFSGCWGLAQQGMQRAGLIPSPEDFDYGEFAQHLFAHDILDLRRRYSQNTNA